MNRRNIKVLKQVIVDIDATIAKVHTMRVDFRKGGVYQRLVNDLDAARVTTRAIIHQQEQPDERMHKATRSPSKHPNG